MLITVFLLSAVVSLSLTFLAYYINFEISKILMPVSALVFLAIVYFIKKGMNLVFAGNAFVFLGSVFINLLIIYTGGIYSPATLWILSGPTVSLLLVNRKWAWIWMVLGLVVIAVFAIIEWEGIALPTEYEVDKKLFYYVSSYTSLFFLLMMVNLIFEKNKNDSKRKVDIANKSITDSITYAKRIQTAMLPTDEEVQRIFPNSFVFFKPKDIISGDFYWIAESGGKKFIAVADCTGHGVPGAMMSAIGHELLNKILFEKKIHAVD